MERVSEVNFGSQKNLSREYVQSILFFFFFVNYNLSYLIKDHIFNFYEEIFYICDGWLPWAGRDPLISHLLSCNL